jgi:transposase
VYTDEQEREITVEARQVKGAQIASAGCLTQRDDHLWLVPSASTGGRWLVDYSAAQPTCTCPDFEKRAAFCKHIFAVEVHVGRLVVAVTEGAPAKKKYTQNWSMYNAAQTNERVHFMHLLHALCDGIQDPPQEGRGRPRTPLTDAVFAMVLKVYEGMSGRRTASEVGRCKEEGHLSKAVSYNTIADYMGDRMLTPLLRKLVQESAAPLADIEHTFAPDSTGFGTRTYDRWVDEKWGTPKKRQNFVKLHAICGTKTHILTDAVVSSTGDAPQYIPLVENTGRRFDIEEVSADKAYLSKENIAATFHIGAIPYIPFKDGTTGKGPELWRKMWAYYQYKRPEFLEHYHRRSNIETAFSMIKAKFNPSVRSKTSQAQANELLCKVLCHNIVVLISSIYELEIEVEFWKPATHGTDALRAKGA